MEVENGCIWKVTTAWGYTHVSRKKTLLCMVRRAYNSKLRCIFQSENRFWWETARWNTSLQVEKMRWYSKLCSGYFINTSPGSSLVENRWWFFLVPVSWRFFLSVQLGWKQKYRMLRLTHVVTHERLVGYFSKNTMGETMHIVVVPFPRHPNTWERKYLEPWRYA